MRTILLLEDRSSSRRSHAAVLSAHGYEVSSAASAQEADSLWRWRRHDLVLLAFSRHDAAVFGFLEKVMCAIPKQRVAFLQDESIYLCPVFQEGRVIRTAEGPEDFVQRVLALLPI